MSAQRNTACRLRSLVRFCARIHQSINNFARQSHPCLNPQNMLNSIRNDLIHAARSLAKARAFTFVCVVSLGIGMAPVIAIPYLSRILTITPRGVKTEGLVEIDTTRVGSRAATDTWSYPDYVDLRDANTGTAIVGWTYGQSEVQK